MPIRDCKIHMPTVYGSSYEDMGKRVSDKYPIGTEQTKLPWAWGAVKARGLTIEQFRSMFVTQAETIDAAWSYEAPNTLTSGYQNTYTKAILPKGKFVVNARMDIPRGGMVGESSFGYYGNGGDQGQVATEYIMHDTEWIGTESERRMFQTPNASRSDNYAYNESFEIVGVRLSGKKGTAGKTTVGWFLKRPGSTTWINQVQANGFNKGFVNVDGVPVLYGTIRAFGCDAGFSGEGTWGADITILKLECDGCNRAFQLIPTSEGAAGGTLKIGLKVEDGVTAGMPIVNSIAGWLEGQYSVEVFGNFSYQNGARPEHLFVVNPTLGGGQNQGSLLVVQGKGFGYGKMLKNTVSGSEWTSAGDYRAFRFEHYADGDGLTTGCPTLTKVGGAPPPVNPPPTGTGLTLTSTVPVGTDTVKREYAYAVDGNSSTYALSGRGMAVGDEYVLTFASRSVSGLTIVGAPTYNNSYARKFEIWALVGGAWVKQGGLFTGAFTSTATFAAVSTTSLKVVVKEANPNWWGSASITLQ